MPKPRRKSEIRSAMDAHIMAMRDSEDIRPARTKRIAKWRPIFLAALANGSSVRNAARKAEIGFSNIYALRAQEPEFAAAWDKAIAAYQRSKFWFKRPVKNPFCTCKVHKPSIYSPTTVQQQKTTVQR
jgi:hypothetical protein